MKHLKFALATAGLMLLSSVASAEVYLGIGGGMTRSNAAERLTQTFENYTTVDSTEKSNAAYILFGGYSFNKNFGIEASYIDFGKYVAKGHDWFGNSITDSLEARAFTVAAVGSVPIGESFSIDGKLGGALVSQTYHCADEFCSSLPDNTERSLTFAGGVGARWFATKNLAVRVAYEHIGSAKYVVKWSDGREAKKTADYGLLYAGAEVRF